MKIEMEILLEKDDLGYFIRIPTEIATLNKWNKGDMLYIPFQNIENNGAKLSKSIDIHNELKIGDEPIRIHNTNNIINHPYDLRKKSTDKMFMNRLPLKEKNILNDFIKNIEDELNDSRIIFEEHKQHYAIKYNKGRAKSWMVIKLSGGNLFLWIRVNPENFNDPKNLSKPYKDAIPHGNRKIILNKANIGDVMTLIRQSYEFRKQDNFEELYLKVVTD